MRLRVISTLVLVGLALAGTDYLNRIPKVQAVSIQDNQPIIYNARIKGKKLILTGEHFSDGAVVLINGEPQKTRNDEESPSTSLIAKKAGSQIPDNAVVQIQVQGTSGTTDLFPFFKGLIITFADVGKPILLKAGDRFLLNLSKGAYQFDATVLDPTVIQKVNDVEVPGSQGIFEAKKAGTTMLTVLGELPCAKTVPACLAPTINLQFTVVVAVADSKLEG